MRFESTGFDRPDDSKFFADSEHSTLESGFKKLRFAGSMWTEGDSAKKKSGIKKYPNKCGGVIHRNYALLSRNTELIFF